MNSRLVASEIINYLDRVIFENIVMLSKNITSQNN